MNENILDLYKQFVIIKKKGYVKSQKKGATGIGYTFESLLGKEEDCFRIPDYNGIEIKTMRYLSKRKIHLFSAVPDGNTLFPIKRIVHLLGYPDKDYREYKVFNVNVDACNYKNVGNNRMKMYINYEKKRMDFLAHNIFGENIEVDASWSFELLEDYLITKLKYLAIVKACKKIYKGEEYFFYNSISFYKLKSFDVFLKLIENGIIIVNFHIGIRKDPANLGKIYDRGTNFVIDESNIEKLFDKISIAK